MNYLFFLSYELFILILNSVATCVKRYFDHDSHKDISGKGCVPIFHPIVQIVLKKKKKTKKKPLIGFLNPINWPADPWVNLYSQSDAHNHRPSQSHTIKWSLS